MPKLTDRTVAGVKPPAAGRLDITDTEVSGLTLRVTAAGAKTWAVRYRPKGGAQRRETLGAYPALKLSDARQRALDVLGAAFRGNDLPKAEAEAKEAAAAASLTIADLVADYVDTYCKRNQRRWKLTERLFQTWVIPHIGARRLVDLGRHDVADMLDRLEAADLRAQVNRVRSQLRAAFAWAMERPAHKHLESNPVAAVKRRKNLEKPRQRVLTDSELRAIWHAAERIGGAAGAFAKMLILTAARRDEARCMLATEIAPGTADWIIPAARYKTKRDHLLPLPELAMAIVRDQIGSRQGAAPVFSVDGKRPYAGQKRLAEILRRESGIGGWTFHDCRRSADTGMAALGIDRDAREAVLGHAKPGLDRVYNVHDYRTEKAAALAAWAEHVAAITKS